MKKYILPFILLILSPVISLAQQDTIPGSDSIKVVPNAVIQFQTDTLQLTQETTESVAVQQEGSSSLMLEEESYSSSSSTSIDAGRTTGRIDVSPTGAASYTVPLALPSGINGVIPQIALIYNSQAGGGVAGVGWNISGLSSITRIPSTAFHDDKVGGINFDNNDRFALDGQRLILKSGTYGADGAEYQTENYSNTKIISRGVSPYGPAYGPAYFEVYYPDGSTAFYGTSSDSRIHTDYAISYSENPQGIRISYHYVEDNSTLLISQISYGSKGSAQALNYIHFIYKNRWRKEQAYIGGVNVFRTKILSEISVVANGQAYRNYMLQHSGVSTLYYDRLIRIQELNGDKSKSFEPIYFNYDSSNSSILAQTPITNLGLSGIETRNSKLVTSDFTGDGTMDFILYPNSKDKLWVFWDPVQPNKYDWPLGQQVTTSRFEDIFPATILSHTSSVLPGQGFTLVKRPDNNTLDFEVYAAGTSYTPVIYQYTKQWKNPPLHEYLSECLDDYTTGEPIPMEYLHGDFNGDGLTDVIAVSKPYSDVAYDRIIPDCNLDPEYCCESIYETFTYANTYFINLDRRDTSTSVPHSGALQKPYNYGEKLYSADFNGDGKTDIVHIVSGGMYVYTLTSGNILSLLWKHEDSRISLSYGALLGDYNGDGKMDIMFPTGDTETTLYSVFISTGKNFYKVEQTYPYSNVKPSWNSSTGTLTLTSLIPNDINGDGKTDMVRLTTVTKNGYTEGTVKVQVFHNTGPASAQAAPDFADGGYIEKTTNLIHYPVPVFLNPDKPNYDLQFGVISDRTLNLFAFGKNFKKDVSLNSISQDGTTYGIDYNPLVSENDYEDDIQVYAGSSKQVYPYVDIAIAPGLQVVKRLRRTFNSKVTQQVFGYRAAVSNTKGLGFLGFGEIIRSNWHENAFDSNRMFSISIHDPQLRGATLKSFTSKSEYLNPAIKDAAAIRPDTTLSSPVNTAQTITASHSITLLPGFEARGSDGTFIAQISDPGSGINDGGTINDYITRTDYTYKTQLLPSKVFVNIASSVSTKDNLSGTNTLAAYTYDSYYNVTKEVTNYSGAGSKTSEITYDNNPGSGYYIGRPVDKKTTLNNGSDTYTTQEQYSYTGFLPTQIKKKGHNTAFITENLGYDTYGNVTQKSVVSAAGTQRTSQMQYDASGRFMTKIIDPEGLEVQYQYDPYTGNTTYITDSYGKSTAYWYDGWGRLEQTVDYLGINTYTSYTKSGYDIIIDRYDDAGQWNVTTVNAIGQTIETKAKDALGQWVGKSNQYDIYDRPIKESEPGINGSYNQWNETAYDEYGRVNQSTSFTGKITNITYNGLSTTVNDGTKSVTTTKNALGNAISVTDPGGNINYTYYANGNLKSADFEGSAQSIEQDGWGRKTKLTDPSAGVYTYAYNDFGELTLETSPKGSTAYTYDANGKVLTKKIKGDATDMSYQYTYDAAFKLLTSLDLTNTDGNNAAYTYTYDTYKRLSSVTEDNTYARFAKTFVYDAFGRISTETSEAKNKSNNKTVSKTILNDYQYGELKSVTDNVTAEKIWEVTALNARGQVTEALLGSAMKQTNGYDAYGYPQQLRTERTGSNPGVLISLGYSFDITRGNLSSRSNSAFGWNESFGYDNQDRLTSFNDNNGAQSQAYDNRGRISSNALGTYVFTGTSYQQTSLTPLNAAANTYYQSVPLQTITYNAFKSSVDISEQGREKVSFQYNAAQGRSHMYYGDEQADKMSRRYRRHYSEEGSMEITEDMQAGTTSFVFYMGGDAYSAPALWKEEHSASGTTQNLYYLHRDHLGSILMITDNQGAVKEQRQFDAWGNIVNLTDGNGNALAAFVVTDRGYTGHEHLRGVGLIHMNGRLYDPKLHRFLSPDNYVQDPTNTQNFNRYGYVLNNPLKFTDPDGEFILVAALLGGVINWAMNGAEFTWKGLGHFAVGAASGAIGAGVGQAVTASISVGGFAGGAIVGAAAGGAGGFVGGAGNAWVGGASFGNGLFAGLKSGVMGAIGGGLVGGTLSGIDAVRSDANFWNGKVNEVGGYAGSNGTYLKEEIPAGAKPTATGDIAQTSSNPNYGKYGYTRNGGTKPHFGVDYVGKEGDKVFAMYDGKVTQIGGSKAYGANFVRTSSVINGKTYNVDYGHMSKTVLTLTKPEIRAGGLIGYMGRLGNLANSTFPTHVHIAVWRPVNGLQGFVMPSWR